MATKNNHSVASILGIITTDTSNVVGDPPRHRQRRNRTLFTDGALELLEQSFLRNQYPDINQRDQLAATVAVTEARIQVWFQNRRSRLRRNKGSPILKIEKPTRSSSPPKTAPTKPEPEPVSSFPSRPRHVTSYPINYPGYMFGYSVLYPAAAAAIHNSAIHPPSIHHPSLHHPSTIHHSSAFHPSASSNHFSDIVGYSSSPISPLWSPTSPDYMKFFESPASPRYAAIGTPLKTMFPFPDVSPARQNYPASLYGGGVTTPTTPMKIPHRMAPLDLSDWCSSENRQSDVKNNSGTSLEVTNINVSTSSDDENTK